MINATLRWLLLMPLMLIGGLHFTLIGVPLGTVLYVTMWGFQEGKPDLIRLAIADNGGLMMMYFGMIVGGPAAFATGCAAALLRLRIASHLLFVLIMALVGALATALYQLVLPRWSDGLVMPTMTILIGAIAAFCCALLYGFWLRPAAPAR